jgi:rhamnulokinase
MSDFLAVDLGATSGRVAIGRASSNSISVDVIHRFSHEVIPQTDGSLFWNWELILSEVLAGLRAAKKQSNPLSLAVDSWAVDYGFISLKKGLLGPIHAYRDPRNAIAEGELHRSIGKERIYSTTGIQFLPFNTIYQLHASKKLSEYQGADCFLMLPDLLNYLLTGVASTEVTNASSTQALNTSTRTWDRELIGLAEIREDLFAKLHEPGSMLGTVKNHGELDGIKVVATASHDTAAAIAAIPFHDRNTEAYISSGTWSLVGVETDAPVTGKAAYEANLTNELGVDGTVRVLKNVTGMWLLEECRREWAHQGHEYPVAQLLEDAKSTSIETLIDPNDPLFAPPGEMPQRIEAYCLDRGLAAPVTPGEFTIVILKSLAHAYKKTLAEIAAVTNKRISTLHIIGGGSQNNLLNQLTADICGVTVKTGPVEATLFGNIAVQAIAAGVYKNLQEARSVIEKSCQGLIFTPR